MIGLASARNNTLSSIATHAWFRLAGANNNIKVETDDGTTDNDANDTNKDYVDATYYKFRIDCSDTSDIQFYLDDVNVTPETMTLAGASAGTLLQPYIEFQKDSGTTTHAIDIDYISVLWNRT